MSLGGKGSSNGTQASQYPRDPLSPGWGCHTVGGVRTALQTGSARRELGPCVF